MISRWGTKFPSIIALIVVLSSLEPIIKVNCLTKQKAETSYAPITTDYPDSTTTGSTTTSTPETTTTPLTTTTEFSTTQEVTTTIPEDTTTTTDATTTSTTNKTTSTPNTTTTTEPSPEPKPQDHSLFYVTNPTNQALCILLTANIQLTIAYQSDKKETRKINLPIDKAFVEGECNEGFAEEERTQWMQLRWNPANGNSSAKSNDDWTLNLNFHRHLNGTMNSLTDMELKMIPSSKVMPGLKNGTYQSEIRSGMLTNDATPVNHTFQCTSEQAVPMNLTKTYFYTQDGGMMRVRVFSASPIEKTTMKLSSLRFDAFRGDNKSKDFNKAVSACDADKQGSGVNVAAAVIIPLILLVLAAVGGYFGYKHYNRRRGPSYEGFN